MNPQQSGAGGNRSGIVAESGSGHDSQQSVRSRITPIQKREPRMRRFSSVTLAAMFIAHLAISAWQLIVSGMFPIVAKSLVALPNSRPAESRRVKLHESLLAPFVKPNEELSQCRQATKKIRCRFRREVFFLPVTSKRSIRSVTRQDRRAFDDVRPRLHLKLNHRPILGGE